MTSFKDLKKKDCLIRFDWFYTKTEEFYNVRITDYKDYDLLGIIEEKG